MPVAFATDGDVTRLFLIVLTVKGYVFANAMCARLRIHKILSHLSRNIYLCSVFSVKLSVVFDRLHLFVNTRFDYYFMHLSYSLVNMEIKKGHCTAIKQLN